MVECPDGTQIEDTRTDEQIRDAEGYQALHATLRRQEELDRVQIERQRAAGARDAAALLAGQADMHRAARRARRGS